MLRKRNDSVKSGKGVDGDLGEDFVTPGPDQFSGYPGNIPVRGDHDIKGRKVRATVGNPAAYTSDDDWPRPDRTDDFQYSAGVRDIFDEVNANSDIRGDSVNANTGPIRSGVNRSQADGSKDVRRKS